MITIKRTAEDTYELIDEDGTRIHTYQQTKMRHPDEWIADAREADATVQGPKDWQFIDARDSE